MTVAPASVGFPNTQTSSNDPQSFYKHADRLREQIEARSSGAKFELSLALGAGLSLLLFNILKHFRFFGPETLKSELILGSLVGVVALVVLVFTGRAFLRSMREAAANFELNLELMQTLGVGCLLAAAGYAGLILQDGASLAFFANLLLLSLLLLCLDRMLHDLMLANIIKRVGLRLDKLKQKPKKGERFTLKQGEVVPCDAIVVEGRAELEERKFAAFKRIRFACVNSEIHAGSLLRAGTLSCQALSELEDSFIATFLAHLDRLVNRDQNQDVLDKLSRNENLILQALLFIGACAAIYWHENGASFLEISALLSAVFLSAGVLRFLRLGVFAQGLALSGLYRNGIVLKSPEVLENLELASTLVLDQPEKNGDIRVKKFELIDDRYERNRVLSAAAILSAASDHPHFVALSSALCELCPEREIFDCSDFHCYEEVGVLGLMQGVEFSLGTEDFLIERGIYLEISEVLQPEQGERVFYLAIKDQVIARMLFVLADFSGAAEQISKIEAQGVRVMACSPLPYEEFKPIGLDKLRLEPKDLFADFSLTRLREKLVALRPVALLSYAVTPAQIERFADVAFVPFDELLCSFERGDVTLCSDKLRGISEAFRISHKFKSVRTQNLALGIGAGTAILICALCGLLGPALALTISSAIGILVSANLLRLSA